MKLIIEIDEADREDIGNIHFVREDLKLKIGKVIMNGTPLDDVLNKIKAEISCNIVEDDTSGNIPARLRADWDAANKAHMIDIALIDRYKGESI